MKKMIAYCGLDCEKCDAYKLCHTAGRPPS